MSSNDLKIDWLYRFEEKDPPLHSLCPHCVHPGDNGFHRR